MTNRLTYDRFRPLLLIALIGAVYAASKKLPILLQMLLYRFGGAAGLPIDDLSRNLKIKLGININTQFCNFFLNDICLNYFHGAS